MQSLTPALARRRSRQDRGRRAGGGGLGSVARLQRGCGVLDAFPRRPISARMQRGKPVTADDVPALLERFCRSAEGIERQLKTLAERIEPFDPANAVTEKGGPQA